VLAREIGPVETGPSRSHLSRWLPQDWHALFSFQRTSQGKQGLYDHNPPCQGVPTPSVGESRAHAKRGLS